ncbi:MAG: helix-turn-helix transcriptional regulator [Chromatiaceae bacterium]|jgi:transcriptional regulator with XRE-family HTH domain|nr:helix-turn-helix transcriptional regulator [Chromatiaceae bacterium]
MELTKRIGARLRSVRHSQGLTLGELSDRTRVLSKSRISNYEQGLRRMGLEEAELLAAALGTVSATYLLCLDDRDVLSGPERALVDLFRRTDARGRESILRLAQLQAAYPDPDPAPPLDPPDPPRRRRSRRSAP